jgi:hypothetical protein
VRDAMSAKEWPEKMLLPPVLLPRWLLIPAIRLRLAAERVSRSATARATLWALEKQLRSAKERSLAWATQMELRSALARATAIEHESALVSFSSPMSSGVFVE